MKKHDIRVHIGSDSEPTPIQVCGRFRLEPYPVTVLFGSIFTTNVLLTFWAAQVTLSVPELIPLLFLTVTPELVPFRNTGCLISVEKKHTDLHIR